MIDPTLLAVTLVWRELDDAEKSALHLSVNFPGRRIDDPDLKGSTKFGHLGTESGLPHASVIEAVNQLAESWNREAGMI